MPRLPMLAGGASQRIMTDVFAGYNHNLKIQDGEFYDTQNLTTAQFPMLASRHKRGVYDGDFNSIYDFTMLQGIIAKEGLCWVDDGTLYINGHATGLTGLKATPQQGETTVEQPEIQLVSMGAYICVFPYKKYYNTMGSANPWESADYGDMEASWSYTGTVNYQMCHQDGTVINDSHVSKTDTEPANPQNGDVWIDTTENTAKTWSSYTETWTVIETVYTRVDFSSMGTIPAKFKAYDGVEISGLYNDDLNGSKIIYALGGSEGSGQNDGDNDYIVLIGILDKKHTGSDSVTIQRKVPKMDYVCEAQNRLWGCRYGNDGAGNVNEIYCCALGDFKNWSQYLGLSTDSWRASCGSDGAWTGCVNYMGSPVFFKENRIHPVSISSIGAHQVGDLPARGVQEGSHRSLAVVNETLYYKSRSGVMAWQGGMPVDVGAALGNVPYYEATAGVFGSRYFVSMKTATNVWNLFVYDVKAGLWMREDNLHAEGFTAYGDELYARVGNSVVLLNGTSGTPEAKVSWYAETGVLHYEWPDHKYVSRYNFRLKMEPGARLRFYVEYDSSGVWEFSGEVRVRNINSFVLPVRPRRCDHLRLKIAGEGEVRIFSMIRVLETGSDV